MKAGDHVSPRLLCRLEEGETDDHVASCDECGETLRALERIRQALPEVGRSLRPDGGWEDQLRAAIRDESPPRPRLLWTAVPLVILAALLIVGWRHLVSKPTFALRVSVESRPSPERGLAVARSGAPRLGDLLVAAATGGDRHVAIWIYRNDDSLLARCPGSRVCAAGDALVARVTIPSVGLYQVVSLSSPRPLPPPTGSFDRDLAAAAQAGIRYATEELEVW